MSINFATLEQKRQEVLRLRLQIEKRDKELHAQEDQLDELEQQKLNISSIDTGGDVRPEDFIDLVHRMESRIKLEELRCQQLRREIQDVMKQMHQHDLLLENLESDQLQIAALTGYRAPAPGEVPKGRGLSHKEQEEAIERILLLRRVVQKSLSVRRQVIERKSQLCNSLVGQLDKMKSQEEKNYELQNEVNVARAELRKREDEFRQLGASHESEDRQLIASEGAVSDQTTVESLQADIEFLRQRIEQVNASGANADTRIRAQVARMDQLEKRCQVLRHCASSFVKDLDDRLSKAPGTLVVQESPSRAHIPADADAILKTEERIPLVLYDILKRYQGAVERSVQVEDMLLREKEDTIETVSKRVRDVTQRGQTESMIARERTRQHEQELRRMYLLVQEAAANRRLRRPQPAKRASAGRPVGRRTVGSAGRSRPSTPATE